MGHNLEQQNLLKQKIEKLINEGFIEEANKILNKYEQIFHEEKWLLTTKSVIHLVKGELYLAEKLLKRGMVKSPFNADILFNLAYLYEQKKDFQLAYDYYLDAEFVLNDGEKEIAKSAVEKLQQLSPNLIKKQKIAVFVKPGLDNFIDDIIIGLEDSYRVRKILVSSYEQINQGMEWADICWFEWCDELIIHASKLGTANEKKLICRLHSYEAFTPFINQVNWNAIDKVIFVAEHIREYVLENEPKLKGEKTIIIPNGINVDNYKFKKRENGFKIAHVGYINYKKGPMLLLHAFDSLVKIDSRYSLHIAGQFQDPRYILYFRQFIKEMKLENNIFFEGWQEDIDQWLEDKNYLLTSSVLESQHLAVMEAMSKGIKPLIHNFVGARSIYKDDYLWTSITEIVDKIRVPYYSEAYRDYIRENFSQEQQMEQILFLIKEILTIKKDIPQSFNYDQYWNNRLNSKFDIEGVGYIGLGKMYNNYLYKARFDVLDGIVQNYSRLKWQSILEIGPGIGLFTDYFNQHDPKNYFAIDISSKSVNTLSAKYPHFKFKRGDISNRELYPIDQKFNLIFGADVLLHLTDESKYKKTIDNLNRSLSDDGIIILLDPITVIGAKSQTDHVVIRDLNYVKEVLKEYDLEIKSIIPTSFFMNYPFDAKLLGSTIQKDPLQIFNLINKFFSNELEKTSQELIAHMLFLLDKLLLLKHGFGLSQKVLIISKKNNNNFKKINISDIWTHEQLSADYKIMCEQNVKDLINNNNTLKNIFNLISKML
jgi:glycosyltransferase involved in cell wall biosynthesis/SAM-dependent methyltransferase